MAEEEAKTMVANGSSEEVKAKPEKEEEPWMRTRRIGQTLVIIVSFVALVI